MKKQIRRGLAFFTAAALLGAAGCGEKPAENPKPAAGTFLFADYKDSFTGTGAIDSQGGRLDGSARTSKLELELAESYSLLGRGLFEIELSSTADISSLDIQFVTEEDPVYTNFKEFSLPVEKTTESRSFSIDLSDTYGWLGRLKGLRISASGINEGEIRLRSFSVKEGGAHYLEGIQLSQPEVYLPSRERMAKKILFGPDGIIGSWRDQQNNLKFIGSANSGLFCTTGTPDAPLETVNYSGLKVENVDWSVFGYCSVAQVVRNPSTGTLIGVTHLERHYTVPGGGKPYTATLGLSISRDDGETWSFLGECISHDMTVGEKTEISRDIGNGAILMDDEYLYVYFGEVREENQAYGLGVSRIALDELYEATEKNEMPKAWKYKDGQWNEPGWEGEASNILPAGIAPNFMSLSYNTVLKKYLMVMCQSPYYSSNDGDILLMVSDDMLDWTQAKTQWLATGRNGEQYPTILGTGDSLQTETGSEFYIYWCSWYAFDEQGNSDWQLLWGSADYVRQKVTIPG